MKGARHYSELQVWELADEIRRRVFSLTERPAFLEDRKAKRNLDDAARSVCRNIAEGFPCSHVEFARFLQFSVRSLNEILEELTAAQQQGYVSAEDVRPIRRLSRRLFPALGRFMAYLRRTPDPEPRRQSKRRGTAPT